MTINFSDLKLDSQLVEAVHHLGYQTPTPVQAAVIPAMLEGWDVLAQSKTGTGKTAAFALPMLHSLGSAQGNIHGLVVVPTRELAMQVASAIYRYGKYKDVRVMPIFGGQSYKRQLKKLDQGVDIVVGTPGRLLDLIRQNKLDLSRVRTVILDEADEMLSMGFIEDIEAILRETPSERQTALFSATLPDRIQQTANRYMRNPRVIRTDRNELTVAEIEQRYYLVNPEDKLAVLTRLFETEPITSALIFTRTRIDTGDLANELIRRGFPAEALNGDLSQDVRTQVLTRFRQGHTKVLVATDVAARGLDIEDISHVFNFDLPNDLESYVHRIGRTARAGRSGTSISLVTPGEHFRIHKLEAYTRKPIIRSEIPTPEEILKKREDDLLNDVQVWLRRGRCKREQEIVAELVEQGHDLLEIAAVALKLARAEEKQRPIEEVGAVRAHHSRKRRLTERSRPHKHSREMSHEQGMVRLTLSKGKNHGVRPNDVVGTMAAYANIPGRSIGKINIQREYTLVDVPERYVTQVFAQKTSYKIHQQPVRITKE